MTGYDLVLIVITAAVFLYSFRGIDRIKVREEAKRGDRTARKSTDGFKRY